MPWQGTMVRILAALVAAAVMSLAMVSVGMVNARAPTPTPTMTPWPSPTPWPTATPTLPPDQVAVFRSLSWLDARLTGGLVVARIGGIECGQSYPVALACDPYSCGPAQDIQVVSNNIKPGCGYDGADISFLVEGRQASRTAVWHAGRQPWLTLTAGLPFAMVSGNFSWPDQLTYLDHDLDADDRESALVPFIGDTPCGYDDILVPEVGMDGAVKGVYRYGAVVYSREQRAGCGYEGAPITFKLLDSQRNVVATAVERASWHAWDGTPGTGEQLDLTLVRTGGIRLGSVGTGDSQSRGESLPSGVMPGLALAGLLMLRLGAALRSRSARQSE